MTNFNQGAEEREYLREIKQNFELLYPVEDMTNALSCAEAVGYLRAISHTYPSLQSWAMKEITWLLQWALYLERKGETKCITL